MTGPVVQEVHDALHQAGFYAPTCPVCIRVRTAGIAAAERFRAEAFRSNIKKHGRR